MNPSQIRSTCGSKVSTSVYPNPACEFCWQCWATARQVAADASVAFMPGSARSYQPALKWHFCGLEGTKNGSTWMVMIQNRSRIVPTFEEQPFSTTPQDHLKVSLFLKSPICWLFSCTSWAVWRASSNFCWPKRSITVTSMRFTGWRCAAGDGPLPNPHLDASERPKVSQPVLSGPWIRCLSLHAGSALLVGGLPTYLGSRTSYSLPALGWLTFWPWCVASRD